MRYPPRREPRVLAIGTVPHGIIFAVVDPWVVRGTGRVYCRARSHQSVVLRLIRREKPTAVIVGNAEISEAASVAAKRCGIGYVTKRPPKIPHAIARELYPELPLFAPGFLARVAELGISTVLHRNQISRIYAHSRHNSTQR